MANLPGVNVTLNDLGLKVAPPPTGPKVTLLGITSNSSVPKLEPLTVTSVDKAINSLYVSGSALGKRPGELAIAIEEAVTAGAQNIEIMVIGHYSGGELDTYLSVSGDKSGRQADLQAAYDVLKNHPVDIVVPLGVYIDDAAATTNLAKELADFCHQATTENSAVVGVVSTLPIPWWAAQHKGALQSGAGGGATTFSGEVDTYYNYISQKKDEGALFETPSSALTDEWVRYITRDSSGFVSKVDGSAEYPTVFANYLSGSRDDSNNYGSAAENSTSVSSAYFTSWQAKDSDGSAAVDSRGNKVDGGSYISVVAGPLKVIASTQASDWAGAVGTTLDKLPLTPGAAAYAGMISSLAPQSATTNKPLTGVTVFKKLSKSQADRLVGHRFVTLFSRSVGLVVTKDVTGAHNVNKYVRSDYVLLSTRRIVHKAVQLVRAISEKYIGEPNRPPILNALSAEIEQGLLAMKSAGALNEYDFVVSSTPDQRVLGEVDITLTLVAAFEITSVTLTVSLAKSLS